MGRRRRRVVAYWSGSSLGRYRHLRRNGDGRRAAGRAVLCGAGLRTALITMGVALLAVLLALPRPSVKANKGKPLPFRAVLGRMRLYVVCGVGAGLGRVWRHRDVYYLIL